MCVCPEMTAASLTLTYVCGWRCLFTESIPEPCSNCQDTSMPVCNAGPKISPGSLNPWIILCMRNIVVKCFSQFGPAVLCWLVNLCWSLLLRNSDSLRRYFLFTDVLAVKLIDFKNVAAAVSFWNAYCSSLLRFLRHVAAIKLFVGNT